MRNAPLINKLLESNVNVRIYDPVAMKEAGNNFGDRVEYGTDIYDAANKVHAIILVTEWK